MEEAGVEVAVVAARALAVEAVVARVEVAEVEVPTVLPYRAVAVEARQGKCSAHPHRRRQVKEGSFPRSRIPAQEGMWLQRSLSSCSPFSQRSVA